MERIPETAPYIAPLGKGVPRLLWSVMIPAYNCSHYLQDAIESVLMQYAGADVMQIEVVDDCSTDTDVEELVKGVGKGHVSYFRQEKNVGSLRNFETCINRARGHYIHLLHGDDRVKFGFYTRLAALFERFPEAGAAFCAYDYINDKNERLRTSTIQKDKAGIFENCLQIFAIGQMTQYVSTVVKREVYEKLGAFYAVTYGEDWIMWARIAKYYPFIYSPEILAEYREHGTSISGIGFENGSNLKDIKKVASVVSSYLPKKEQQKAKKTIIENYTYWLWNYSSEMGYDTKKNKILHQQLSRQLHGFGNHKVFTRKLKNFILSKIKQYTATLKLF